ncbi:MAG: phosphoenolpyruvate--protein phosphotransferase [Anaerolineae bacterium]|nr:phosphoenolpyruvate--protein phosphotransferase [Anaerolineae bacterium]
MKKLKGIAASPGIAIGRIFKYETADLSFDTCTIEDTVSEWERIETAFATAREECTALYEKTCAEIGEEEAAIFEAHMMMLEDPELLDAIQTSIAEECINAEAALTRATEHYAEMLEALEDPYLRARAVDIRDIGRRVLRILLGKIESPAEKLREPSIVVAQDLTPSDTAGLDKKLVLGFVTAEGGATSHTAILARALSLPAVLGIGPEVYELTDGNRLIVDGADGVVLVDPDDQLASNYKAKQMTIASVRAWANARAHEPAITADGTRVEVVANIGDVAGARDAVAYGAEGAGLLRTEFLYLERSDLPTEDEQYTVYTEILDVFEDAPVILRTLDIGGDKALPWMNLPKEMNPFLGVRALRLAMHQPETLLKPQLRAALRVAAGRNLKVMFPMVATVGEVRAVRAKLGECRAELISEGHPVPDVMEIGIMVEIPAAAIMADRLAEEVDFFSIGTNDLTQYTMAADRGNAAVAHLLHGLQPAVLRLVSLVIHAAHNKGKWVGMCGELAGEPLAIPILLGLGLDEFSMNPPAIPIAKQIIRAITMEEAQKVAREALEQENPQAVERLVKDHVAAVDMTYLLSLREKPR